MAQYKNLFEVDLSGKNAPVMLRSMISEGNAAANIIGAAVFDNCEPVQLNGSCTGRVLRADGNTVALVGTIDGNTAYVTLDSQCYAIPGTIVVIVNWVSGENVTTLVKACGTVERTQSGGIIETETIPNLDELLAQIERMEEVTEAAEEAAERAEEAAERAEEAAEGIEEELDGKLGVSDYSAAAAVGTADNLIDRKATATEQEWLGLRTSCADVSISDDGTARIDAIYGNTVDGVNMTVDAIETVGFNLWNKAEYIGATETLDSRTVIKFASSADTQKTIADGEYLGLGQIEVCAYIYRQDYAPRVRFSYADGTTEDIAPYNGSGSIDTWKQFYFISNSAKAVTSVMLRNNSSSRNHPGYADIDSICIHYVWSGYRNGEFEEYWKRVLELPISTYFPNGMMSTETVRDELRADKAIQRCELSGGVVVALAEPVETPIDPPLNLVYKVSDFGTENAKSSGTSAPFIADIAYNSDFTRMIVNNSDHIGTLPNLQTTAKNSLVAAINELVARLSALEGGA